MLAAAAEFGLHIFGHGLRRFARNAAGWLNLACLLSLIVEICGVRGASFAYLRMLRALEPFRFSRHLVMAQRMIEVVIETFTLLPPVGTLASVFVILIAALGRNTFGTDGRFYDRCVRTQDSVAFPEVPGDARETALTDSGDTVFLVEPHAWCSNVTRGMGGYGCSGISGETCARVTDWPAVEGLLEFDDFAGALRCTLTVLLQQDFSVLFFPAVDTSGQLAALWFLAITVCGTYFLLNYSTAIVAFAYSSRSPDSPDAAQSVSQLLHHHHFKSSHGHGHGHGHGHEGHIGHHHGRHDHHERHNANGEHRHGAHGPSHVHIHLHDPHARRHGAHASGHIHDSTRTYGPTAPARPRNPLNQVLPANAAADSVGPRRQVP